MSQALFAPYKAVLFDLDGTLVHYTRNYASFAKGLADRLEVPHQHAFLDTYHKYIQAEGAVCFSKAIVQTFCEMGLPMPNDLGKLTSECILAYGAGIERLPHTARLLAQTAHLPRALVSNGPQDMQLIALGSACLAHEFQAILISGDSEIGVRKPSPKIFHLACEKLGVSPSEAIMIGDNVEADIKGAEAAGLSAVHIDEVIKWLQNQTSG